jgi:hypothetical protein
MHVPDSLQVIKNEVEKRQEIENLALLPNKNLIFFVYFLAG